MFPTSPEDQHAAARTLEFAFPGLRRRRTLDRLRRPQRNGRAEPDPGGMK
jgi:hypothetical protein